MTTENQPRDPDVNVRADLTLGHGTNTWTDGYGIHGIARLGGVSVTFHTARQVRDVIAYLAVIAGEMDAETARNAARAGDRKAHYYRDSVSLCRRVGFYTGPLDPADTPSRDDCAACRRELLREAAKRGAS
jgi:hypothetical protein